MAFQGEISAENGIFALSRPNIRTWTTMPLKVWFIQGSRGFVTDISPLKELKNLEYLNLEKNQLNKDQINSLKEALPKLKEIRF